MRHDRRTAHGSERNRGRTLTLRRADLRAALASGSPPGTRRRSGPGPPRLRVRRAGLIIEFSSCLEAAPGGGWRASVARVAAGEASLHPLWVMTYRPGQARL